MRKPLEQGGFPRPVPLSGRMVAWSEKAVLTWVNDRIAGAEAPCSMKDWVAAFISAPNVL
eukprot:gene47143-58832_t